MNSMLKFNYLFLYFKLFKIINLGGLIESKSYGIGTTHGSPYRDRISNEILQLQENGFLNNLYIKWWKERNLPERCDDLDVDHKKRLFTNELDLKNIGTMLFSTNICLK